MDYLLENDAENPIHEFLILRITFRNILQKKGKKYEFIFKEPESNEHPYYNLLVKYKLTYN